jgi:hypothetical protein
LLEGRVGLLIDGIPLAIMMPVNFNMFFRVPEDSSHHYIASGMVTLLRYCALILATLLPAVVVAISMYHQEMIPSKLLLSMVESKQQVPFPTAVEILGLLFSFMLLQEAQLRLPSPVGGAVNIIGALIVGQAAVEAKIVSPVAVIVFAISAIACYTVTDFDLGMTCQVCRLIMVIAGILAGLYGVIILTVLIYYHLCSLTSLGVPYMLPFGDGQREGFWKLFMRAPLRREKNRPQSTRPVDRRNQA